MTGYCYACGAWAQQACRLRGADVRREHAEHVPNWEVSACADCAHTPDSDQGRARGGNGARDRAG